MAARYRFGIEEEFFLADAATRGTPTGNLKAFHAAAKAQLPEAERELLQLQIETASSPPTMSRKLAAPWPGCGRARHGGARSRAPAARLPAPTLPRSGPTSGAPRSSATPTSCARRRWSRLATWCAGCTSTSEVPDPEGRVDLMNRFLPFTPLLLGLSCSSPFW